MTASLPQPHRMSDLEARIVALGALANSVITALMLHGLLPRAEIAPLIARAEELMSSDVPRDAAAAARAELAAVEARVPPYLRATMGPPPGKTTTIIEEVDRC